MSRIDQISEGIASDCWVNIISHIDYAPQANMLSQFDVTFGTPLHPGTG